MAWLFWVGSQHNILIHTIAEKYIFKNIVQAKDMQDRETAEWKASLLKLAYMKLDLEIWKVSSARNILHLLWPNCPACSPWPAVAVARTWKGKKNLWFPPHHTKESSVMGESLPYAWVYCVKSKISEQLRKQNNQNLNVMPSPHSLSS